MTEHEAVTDGDVKMQAQNLFAGKLEDFERRTREGTLPFLYVEKGLQELLEGKAVIGGLLKYFGSLKLKAVKHFVVADSFKVGNVVGGRAIGWVGGNSQHHFGDIVEEDVPARVVHIWELAKSSLDAPIITLLGGADNPKTQLHLAHQFQMMALGEKSKGRLDGYANFAYKVSPRDSSLLVPYWYVHGGKFDVEAGSSSGSFEWPEGHRVCGG